MTLQFSQTSPGVHMATWEHPKSGIFRTAVIIESLETFTLYIDGEVVARDLPAYEQATTRAEIALNGSGARRLVAVAAGLVLFAVIGGSGVALSKLLTGPNDLATEPATGATVLKPRKSVRKTQPVTTVTISKVRVSAAHDQVVPASRSAVAVASAKPQPESTGVSGTTVSSAAKTPKKVATVKVVVDERVSSDQSVATGNRVFSASRPMFGAPAATPAGTQNEQRITLVPDTSPTPGDESIKDPATTSAEPASKTSARNLPATAEVQAGQMTPEARQEVASVPSEAETTQAAAVPLPDRNPLDTGDHVVFDETPASSARALAEPTEPKQIAVTPSKQTRTKRASKAKRQRSIRTSSNSARRKTRSAANKIRTRLRKTRHNRVVHNNGRVRLRVMSCMIGRCGWVYLNDRAAYIRFKRRQHLYR